MASQMSYNGIEGHLVTITSAEENDFLRSILNTTNGLNSSGFEVLHPDALGHWASGSFYTAGSDADNEEVSYGLLALKMETQSNLPIMITFLQPLRRNSLRTRC